MKMGKKQQRWCTIFTASRSIDRGPCSWQVPLKQGVGVQLALHPFPQFLDIGDGVQHPTHRQDKGVLSKEGGLNDAPSMVCSLEMRILQDICWTVLTAYTVVKSTLLKNVPDVLDVPYIYALGQCRLANCIHMRRRGQMFTEAVLYLQTCSTFSRMGHDYSKSQHHNPYVYIP